MILGLTGAAALAQESNTVGPPALKDFQLPGQRTTPVQPQPQPKAQPKSQEPARPVPSPPPAATEPRSEPRTGQPKAAAPRPALPAPRTEPAAEMPVAAEPGPAPAILLPPERPPAQAPQAEAPAASGPSGGWSPFWLAVPALLALLGLGAFLRRRRASLAFAEAGPTAAAASPGPQPRPQPVPAPAPAPLAAGPRARLEVDFLPLRAAATDSEAAVHYDLVLRNDGEAPAGNIRIDTRMFNAGDERGIRAFLDGPIHDESGSPHILVPPGGDLKLSSAIALPRAELREIELQGRRVFVPVVAINVAYDWPDGGRGRTSRSWLVGREPEEPAAKMGPFRLDLGPRIYRSVGGRPTRLANVA